MRHRLRSTEENWEEEADSDTEHTRFGDQSDEIHNWKIKKHLFKPFNYSYLLRRGLNLRTRLYLLHFHTDTSEHFWINCHWMPCFFLFTTSHKITCLCKVWFLTGLTFAPWQGKIVRNSWKPDITVIDRWGAMCHFRGKEVLKGLEQVGLFQGPYSWGQTSRLYKVKRLLIILVKSQMIRFSRSSTGLWRHPCVGLVCGARVLGHVQSETFYTRPWEVVKGRKKLFQVETLSPKWCLF